ncbi:MAG TPA: MlaD family protein [Terriglobales bacterium]|jgi:phospholipid/cholesterol/gamma-HCH transport system substrate-binding protein|nr:MlaD family protein [Terriglobales bacterium]
MPSQAQLQWSRLRVGITVVVAMITLVIVIFLISSSTGLFTHQIYLKTYFDNAEGLRRGAPVRLQGVDIGNVTRISVDPSKPLTPVEVTMKVNTRFRDFLRKDSTAELSTAGVLGETYIDINSSQATGPLLGDGDVLPAVNRPDLQDVIRSSQSSLQNVDVLVRRLDRIVAAVEEGKGSIGKLIYDPSLFNRLNITLNEMQQMVGEIHSGKGSIGKLIESEELYDKANASVDKLNSIIDEINQGQGTVGKLLKDDTLYKNLNQTVAKTNALMDEVDQGKGALGMLAKNEEFARKLDRTMTNLNTLTTNLNDGKGTMGKLFVDPSLYNNSDKMLVETRSLVQAIRENPKKYLTIHFKIF